MMAIGIGLSPLDILSIEADALVDGYKSETADFYAYWLDRLTRKQLDMQMARARDSRRFR